MENKKKFRFLGIFMNIPSFSRIPGELKKKFEKFRQNIPEFRHLVILLNTKQFENRFWYKIFLVRSRILKIMYNILPFQTPT